MTTAALALGLVIANIVKPGAGLNAVITGGTPAEVVRFAKAAQEPHTLGDFFLAIVPDNAISRLRGTGISSRSCSSR